VIVPFHIFSAETGAPLADDPAELIYFARTNPDGSIDDLTDSAPPVVSSGLGYNFTIDDALFTRPGCAIGYVIDCTDAAAARYLAGHSMSREAAPVDLAPSPTSTADWKMKRGDLFPVFDRVLVDEHGHRIDLTDRDVTFRMRMVGADVLKVNAAADIIDEKKGHVRYACVDGDTNLAGLFDAEFFVEDGGDVGPRTVPANGFFRVEIANSLAD
jgi:hypothetical protein